MSEEQKRQLDMMLRQGSLDTNADVATLRAGFEAFMAQVPVPPDVVQRPLDLGGVAGLELAIDGDSPDDVILYFHSGVYVIGSAAATVPLVGDIIRRAGTKAVTIDYRLAPENPYPAAVEDARSAYDAILGMGYTPDRVVLAGESAGGGLAIALLIELRDAGLPLPACAYVLSPYVDLTLAGESLTAKAALDPLLTPRGLAARVPDYVGSGDAADPLISPIFADLTDLPPLLIQVGSHEVLLSDAIRLAAQAAMCDVAVTLDVTPGVPHVFQSFAGLVDEAGEALDRAATFLVSQLRVTQ